MFPDPNKGERFLTVTENLKVWATFLIVNVSFWGTVLVCI